MHAVSRCSYMHTYVRMYAYAHMYKEKTITKSLMKCKLENLEIKFIRCLHIYMVTKKAYKYVYKCVLLLHTLYVAWILNNY